MADFFEALESATPGDKLAREPWNGEKWVEAPATLTSRFHIDALIIKDAGGPTGDDWLHRMEDMAENDWVSLP